MKVKFIKDGYVGGKHEFKIGQIHDLVESSANRWIVRGIAVLHDESVEEVIEEESQEEIIEEESQEEIIEDLEEKIEDLKEQLEEVEEVVETKVKSKKTSKKK